MLQSFFLRRYHGLHYRENARFSPKTTQRQHATQAGHYIRKKSGFYVKPQKTRFFAE